MKSYCFTLFLVVLFALLLISFATTTPSDAHTPKGMLHSQFTHTYTYTYTCISSFMICLQLYNNLKYCMRIVVGAEKAVYRTKGHGGWGGWDKWIMVLGRIERGNWIWCCKWDRLFDYVIMYRMLYLVWKNNNWWMSFSHCFFYSKCSFFFQKSK